MRPDSWRELQTADTVAASRMGDFRIGECRNGRTFIPLGTQSPVSASASFLGPAVDGTLHNQELWRNLATAAAATSSTTGFV
jgi:hypothetical protein